MKGYTKASVTQHSDGFGRDGQPAVNVKVRDYPVGAPNRDGPAAVRSAFACSEATALQALEWAFETHREAFWQDAQALATETFGPCVVYAEGRSDGWLTVSPRLGNGLVTGRPLLPPVSDWDGVLLHRWATFKKRVGELVAYHCAWEHVREAIEANDWAHDQTAQETVLREATA